MDRPNMLSFTLALQADASIEDRLLSSFDLDDGENLIGVKAPLDSDRDLVCLITDRAVIILRVELSSNTIFKKLIKICSNDFLLESLKKILEFRDLLIVENTLIIDMTV